MANSLLLFPHNLPVGWRFDPTDEELVDHYLKRKRRGDPIYGLDIGEVKLSDYNPWDLPSLSNNKSKDKMWFFFSLREYCNNGVLRKAGKGSWKSTGDPRSVTPEGSDEEIGTKRTLVFHNPGATHWVMHEYEFTAELNSPVKGNYVLCKIKENPCEKKKTVKRPMKAEPSCKKPRTKKKARKGESDFNMASVSPSLSAFEDQKSKETMGNSTYVVGEPSIRNHMISGLGNQKSNKMPAIPTCENGELSNLEAFDSDNQSQCEMTPISTCIQGEIGSISSFSNQISCQMTDASFSNGGEARCPMASDLENYNPNNMACMLSYKNCETRCLMASDLENYSPNQMTAMPSCKKGKRSCPAASGLENQNSYNDITIVSTNNECETICPVIFDENQNSNEMTNESFYEKGKPNYLGAVDFENQNPSKSIGISTSTEGVWSSLFEEFSDFDNQNQYQKTDVSLHKDYSSSYVASNVSLLKGYPSPYLSPNIGEITFQEAQSQNKVTDILIPNYQSPLMTSNFQGAMLQNPIYTTERPILEDNCPGMVSDGREATFPEMDPQLVEELTAFFELEDCVNSAPEQPSHTMESQSKSIDISASAEGVKSSLFETPSDFDNQNRYEKTDVSLLKGYPSPYLSPNIGEITFQEAQSQNKVTDILIPNYQSPLMTSNFQGAMLQNPIYTTERPILEDNCPGMVSDGREATFPEMDPQMVEEY
uniref:NAC transcription factor 066 n=1 Tax=Jatropha curcas TaxID=180498 RepID=R4N5R9_JATCU|nr:NAC transcription factor 066 [Jatropha curcas]